MSRRGAHPHKALTPPFVAHVRRPGFYSDGAGLYLRVDQSGAKRWILRSMIQGRRRDMGLGSAAGVSLELARRRANEYRAMARAGEDPIAARRAQRA